MQILADSVTSLLMTQFCTMQLSYCCSYMLLLATLWVVGQCSFSFEAYKERCSWCGFLILCIVVQCCFSWLLCYIILGTFLYSDARLSSVELNLYKWFFTRYMFVPYTQSNDWLGWLSLNVKLVVNPFNASCSKLLLLEESSVILV